MSRSTVTPAEALQRLLDASKLIDFADCKDDRVWQALGATQGTAEGVLRDGLEPGQRKQVAYNIDLVADAHGRVKNYYDPCDAASGDIWTIVGAIPYMIADLKEIRAATPVAAQSGVVTASVPEAVLQAATEWWLGLRPLGWNEEDHLAQPAVNSSTGRGSKLALAVAAYVAAPAIAAPTEVERKPTIWINSSASPHEDHGPLIESNRQIVLIGSTEGPFGFYTTPLYAAIATGEKK